MIQRESQLLDKKKSKLIPSVVEKSLKNLSFRGLNQESKQQNSNKTCFVFFFLHCLVNFGDLVVLQLSCLG